MKKKVLSYVLKTKDDFCRPVYIYFKAVYIG